MMQISKTVRFARRGSGGTCAGLVIHMGRNLGQPVQGYGQQVGHVLIATAGAGGQLAEQQALGLGAEQD